MKTIFIGSTPNLEKEDLDITKDLLKRGLDPSSYKQNRLEEDFKEYLNIDHIYFTNTGRTSLYLILKTLGIREDDEVITQSFSCMAASQPILWVGAKPVFADIEKEGFNIDIEDIRSKITVNTKAVIVQHMFGIPVDIRKEIDEINKERSEESKIFLIEDCAHSLGTRYKDNELVGSKGDFAYFSFSQDKIISSVQGGSVICNYEKYKKILKTEYEKLEMLPKEEVRYLLKYRLAWDKIKNTYSFPTIKSKYSLGKMLVLIFRRLGIIKPQVNVRDSMQRELCKMSETQKEILEIQFKKLERYNNHRVKISDIYNQKLNKDLLLERRGSFLRYPILVMNPEEVRIALRNKHVVIGNWYNHPIYPKGVNMEEFGYEGNCPIAEEKCKYVLNLPTNIVVEEDRAIEIAEIVNKYAKPFKF